MEFGTTKPRKRGSPRRRYSKSKQRSIEQYMPLVISIAGRMVLEKYGNQSAFGVDDLVQEGVFGLSDAIDRFNPARGVKFATYAAQRIRGQMKDAIRRLDWVPRTVRQGNQDVPKVRSIESTIYHRGYYATEEGTLADIVPGRSPDPAAVTASRARWDALVRCLYPEQRLLLKLYYVESLTMHEIAMSMGLSESRVSQMIGQALAIVKASILTGGTEVN